MFLKMRVPFFSDFDKKTLKLVSERFAYRMYSTNESINKFNEEAETLFVVVSGRVGHFNSKNKEELTNQDKPDSLSTEIMNWGHEGMTQDKKWNHTSIALKKTMVICLDKRDLIEVL